MVATELVDRGMHVCDRIAGWAAERGDDVAITHIDPRGRESAITWAELERGANKAARVLEVHGASTSSPLALALPTGFSHVVVTLGAWKIGATVVPLNPEAGERERLVLREAIAGPLVGMGDWADIPIEAFEQPGDDSSYPSRGVPRSASVTGGSTGLPRIIMRRQPWCFTDEQLADRYSLSGMAIGQTQLVVLPLYHAGFTCVYQGLVLGHTILLLPTFNASVFLDGIRRHRVQYIRIAPSYLRLALDVPDIESYDLSSLEAVYHGSAACSDAVKRRWIELIGADKIFEDYGCTEGIGMLLIRGDAWLEHPGTVGRPTTCEVAILDEEGAPVPQGEVGLVYMRTPGGRQPEYLSSGPLLEEHDGFLTVGDLGFLDADGYLHLIDRKINVINSGGIDIYPTEIEAVLLAHPDVADVAIIGRPHEYLGKVLHAIVVGADRANPPDIGELDRYCRQNLTMSKVPFSYEFKDDLGRAETGKLRRRDLE